nr:hypothetical protein Iba_chr11eCG10270 [Ipomoea batatas]
MKNVRSMLPPKNTIAYCSQFFPISYVLLPVVNPPSSLKIEGRGSKRNSKSGSEGDKRKEVEGRMAPVCYKKKRKVVPTVSPAREREVMLFRICFRSTSGLGGLLQI